MVRSTQEPAVTLIEEGETGPRARTVFALCFLTSESWRVLRLHTDVGQIALRKSDGPA